MGNTASDRSSLWNGDHDVHRDALEPSHPGGRGSLSPELAAAHGARTWALQTADFEWRGAEVEYRRAVALTPNDGDAKCDLAGRARDSE